MDTASPHPDDPGPTPTPRPTVAPIPSLDLLGDRMEAAAVRAIEARDPARRARGDRRSPAAPRRSLLAGGRAPWQLALLPAMGVAVVVALLVVVFADGGTTPQPASAAMVAAADRTAALPTGRFSLEIDLRAGGLSRGLTMVGAYDEGAGLLRAEADLSSLLAGVGGAGGPGGIADIARMEVIVDHDRGYLRSPFLQSVAGAPTPWFSVEPSELGGLFGRPSGAGGATGGSAPRSPLGSLGAGVPLAADPSALLELVRHTGGTVELLGTERIEGADTTHYRATSRLDDAVAKLGEEDRESVRSLLAALGDEAQTGSVPIDVWVGPGGLVRRIAVAASAAAGDGATPSAASITVDYLDPGQPVEIVVPEQTTPLEPLLSGALGGVLGR